MHVCLCVRSCVCTQALQGDQASVFKAGWFQAPTQWSSGFSQDESNTWAALLTIRDAVNATMEKVRHKDTLQLHACARLGRPG